MPRIVELDLDLRVGDDVEVVLGEVGRDDRGTSGSISAMVCASTVGSIDTAPAVTPAPQPITSTDARVLAESSVVIWPSIRCSRMSCGSLDAWTLPAL